jgi:glycosyltransferase involved in cell wall biosynthesis
MKTIFYHPTEIRSNDSASSLRPAKMLKALKLKMSEVIQVSGSRCKIKVKQSEIIRRINAGEAFDFLYLENLSTPITLKLFNLRIIKIPYIDKLHISFIKFCKSNNIKIMYFFRDIQWLYGSQETGVHPLKVIVLKFFGLLELDFVKKNADIVYVPSKEMASILSQKYQINARVLPPRSEIKQVSAGGVNGKLINLFYVGGSGPIYNPKLFIEAVGKLNNVNLIFCTRKEEWSIYSKSIKVPHNVEIIHKSGEELEPYYKRCDICVYSLPPYGYAKIAFPFKVSEYISFCKPIVAFEGTGVATFIREHNIGWTMDYSQDGIIAALSSINDNRFEYNIKSNNVAALAQEWGWSKNVDIILEDVGRLH